MRPKTVKIGISDRLQSGHEADSGSGRRLSRSGPGSPGQADKLTQVKSSSGHPQLKIGFNQAGGAGITCAEKVGQVEDDPFDEGALFHFLFEWVSFGVCQGG
jgi:hypothetical protein